VGWFISTLNNCLIGGGVWTAGLLRSSLNNCFIGGGVWVCVDLI